MSPGLIHHGGGLPEVDGGGDGLGLLGRGGGPSVELTSDPKPRLRWTADLHDRFVDAIAQLGGPEKAKPKAIMRTMGVKGITLFHLKSHLQKYRLARQSGKELTVQSTDGQNDVDMVQSLQDSDRVTSQTMVSMPPKLVKKSVRKVATPLTTAGLRRSNRFKKQEEQGKFYKLEDTPPKRRRQSQEMNETTIVEGNSKNSEESISFDKPPTEGNVP